ncbi:hypothetical protein HPB50_021493 [Hyalomma asiaticum]|uniref:Uncharacterized protein n=1 Tax=Hyalomma asiaticum TaxID=266040 RepID=A0ACB7SJQ6_HYAAI|nr:hypothetical protein HPB50_021493 [Hyalomma asiaticum]
MAHHPALLKVRRPTFEVVEKTNRLFQVSGSDSDTGHRHVGHQRRPLVVVALTVGGVLFGVLVSAVLAMLFMQPSERPLKGATVKTQSDGCLTIDCRFAANKMLAAMNRSVKPCDDFYEYMCGNYNGPEANIFEEVEQKIQASLKEHLKSARVPEAGQNAWEKAAGMFQACTDVGLTLNTQMADLQAWLASQRLDFFNMTEDSSYDAVEALVMLSLQYHLPALVTFEVDRMRFLNKKRSVSVRTDSILLSECDGVNSFAEGLNFTLYGDDVNWYLNYHKGSRANKTEKRSRYEAHLISYGLRGEALQTMSRTLEAYGSHVAAALDRLMKQPAELAVVRISDLGNLTKGHVESGRWASIFGRYTGGVYNGEDYIQVQSWAPSLLVELISAQAVGTHGMRCLLAWKVLRWVGDLASTASAIAEADGKPFDNVCYKLVLMVMEPVLMRKYDDINANTGAARRAQDMVDNIRATYKRFLNTFSWIGDEARKTAEQRISNMAAFVGYPDNTPDSVGLNGYYEELNDSGPTRFFHDWRTALELYARRLVRDQEHVLFTSVKTNVSYFPAANAITVPAGALQPGIFYQEGPASVNYGGLGTVKELNDSGPTRFFHDWRTALELYARRLVRDQEHVLFTSVKTNVSYFSAANAITVPAGALQPGIFYQEGPASVNYGGLGTIIAREMAQIFDTQASALDQAQSVSWNGSDEDQALCLHCSLPAQVTARGNAFLLPVHEGGKARVEEGAFITRNGFRYAKKLGRV